MPAPPMPTKCSRRPLQSRGVAAARARASSSPAAQQLAGDPLRGIRASKPLPRPRHARAAARRSASSSRHHARKPRRGRARCRRSTTAAPASAIQRALSRWCSAVACGYGTSTAGLPAAAISNTEPPARATHQVAGRERVGQAVEIFVEAVVRRAGRAAPGAAPARRSRAARRRAARPRHGPLARANASSAARLIERAPRLPPNTNRQRASARRCRAAPVPRRGRASRIAPRHRPARDQIALAVPPVDRERRGRRGAQTARAGGWRARAGCRTRSAPAACATARPRAPTGPAT